MRKSPLPKRHLQKPTRAIVGIAVVGHVLGQHKVKRIVQRDCEEVAALEEVLVSRLVNTEV